MAASPNDHPDAIVMAGIPETNLALYHRIRFAVGDPAAIIDYSTAEGGCTSMLIIRDIEMDRARAGARAEQVTCPADHAPAGGLSGDRATATAQSLAEFLAANNLSRVRSDRTLPLIFAHHMQERGISFEYDENLGVLNRRQKDEAELDALRAAQAMTERAVELACTMIANASAGSGGALEVDGAPLTSERVRTAVDTFFLEQGYANDHMIVAGGSQGGDCHERGTGQLYTEQPIIIDIFPRDRATGYNGDCTRTVVHGAIPEEVARMHAAVVEAKGKAIAAVRAGATGEDVHRATMAVIESHGYPMGLPPADAPDDFTSMPHGTGHGVGLEVHEPPLLDLGGPELLVGDVLTVEPGLYGKVHGGIRVEDMVAVTADGCVNFNTLPEHLTWK